MTRAAVELYVRQGSRFVRANHARPVPPIPTPVPVDIEHGARPGGGWTVPAPKCPHGRYARYAARNCCAGTP